MRKFIVALAALTVAGLAGPVALAEEGIDLLGASLRQLSEHPAQRPCNLGDGLLPLEVPGLAPVPAEGVVGLQRRLQPDHRQISDHAHPSRRPP